MPQKNDVSTYQNYDVTYWFVQMVWILTKMTKKNEVWMQILNVFNFKSYFSQSYFSPLLHENVVDT